jgi:hypothetical protein
MVRLLTEPSLAGVGGARSTISPGPCSTLSVPTSGGSPATADTLPFGASAAVGTRRSSSAICVGVGEGVACMGTDTGDVSSSRCFSTRSGVGERSAEDCLNPACFSCGGTCVGAGAGVGGSVELRDNMLLRRSFENSDGRFVGGAGAVGRGEPSRTSVGGSGSGDAGMGAVGLGDETAKATRLSATSVSRTAVGVPGAFSTENFSCRYRASVSSLCCRTFKRPIG